MVGAAAVWVGGGTTTLPGLGGSRLALGVGEWQVLQVM
jgi:hypothetical protein